MIFSTKENQIAAKIENEIVSSIDLNFITFGIKNKNIKYPISHKNIINEAFHAKISQITDIIASNHKVQINLVFITMCLKNSSKNHTQIKTRKIARIADVKILHSVELDAIVKVENQNNCDILSWKLTASILKNIKFHSFHQSLW